MSQFILYQEDDTQQGALAATLQRAGMEVFRCGPEGMNGRSDPEQLEFATAKGWVIYTSNTRDFAVLHRDYLQAGRTHAGIIYRTRQRYSVGEQARRIIRIWEALSAEEMVNRYEAISQWGEDRG